MSEYFINNVTDPKLRDALTELHGMTWAGDRLRGHRSKPGYIPPHKVTMFRIDQRNGEIETIPNMDANPNSILHYWRQGFRLDPKDLKPKTQEVFVCPVEGCQAEFPTQQGLAGHMRKHRSKEK